MPKNWKTRKLGDLVTLQRGHDLPKAQVVKGKYPIAGSNGIIGFHNNFTTKAPGITIGRSGNIGNVYYYEKDFWAHNTTLYVKEFKGCDEKFIYYLLRTLDFRGHNSGSAVPSLNRNYIHPIEIDVPEDINEQRRIATFLSSLDSKIELNQQMNATLEAIAQAIFKRWFVDFQFPGFDGELVNRLPKNWRNDELKNHLSVDRGLSYKGEGLAKQGEGVPMHNLNSVYEGGGYKYEGIKFYSGTFKEKHLAKPRDLIIANTEQGHKYLLIGFPAVVPYYFGQETIYSHHIYRVRPRPESCLTPQFIYYLLLQSDVREQVVGCSNGTTVNMLKIDGLQMPKFVLPTRDIVSMFSELIESIWQRQESIYVENQTLTNLRDSLLPKLMSGKIRVAE